MLITTLKRCSPLLTALLLASPPTFAANENTALSSKELKVHKSPSCGCCGKWMEHMESNGFHTTKSHPMNLPAVKESYQIAPVYQSCHTAVSQQGYIFEGHVPARYVSQFLNEQPNDALGLAVPAMPAGSPGMEMGNQFQPYQVLLLKKGGGYEVYAEVTEQQQQY